jgi:hypothetical protein
MEGSHFLSSASSSLGLVGFLSSGVGSGKYFNTQEHFSGSVLSGIREEEELIPQTAEMIDNNLHNEKYKDPTELMGGDEEKKQEVDDMMEDQNLTNVTTAIVEHVEETNGTNAQQRLVNSLNHFSENMKTIVFNYYHRLDSHLETIEHQDISLQKFSLKLQNKTERLQKRRLESLEQVQNFW